MVGRMKLPNEVIVDYSHAMLGDAALLKFAERVVRDCAECAKSFPGEFVNSTTQRQATANAILKRYGLT